jgi:hypothetical protein
MYHQVLLILIDPVLGHPQHTERQRWPVAPEVGEIGLILREARTGDSMQRIVAVSTAPIQNDVLFVVVLVREEG